MKKISTKKLLILVACLLTPLILVLGYLMYNIDEHIIECKTNNFYYIYGVLDENTCILLKRVDKMSEEELEVVREYEAENGELEGLVMVDTAVSAEAKKNYMASDVNMDVYGIQNTYLCEKGTGIFKHTFEKTMDVMYLTDNTAIKLGVKEGELNYDYVQPAEGDMSVINSLLSGEDTSESSDSSIEAEVDIEVSGKNVE